MAIPAGSWEILISTSLIGNTEDPFDRQPFVAIDNIVLETGRCDLNLPGDLL
ncbi:hypothetical protein DPMN_170564 [Dreissena polymorpha]|uniref:Uncharacterized protein n=1 Tax=Dreissena polymorpha TaxID=45954 RepID=A0A9D4DWJ0_DREPO|nr:hypothetical protein DPMN_170564 [Dreissena polymorpha]